MKFMQFVAPLALLCNAAYTGVLAAPECPAGQYPVSVLGDPQNYRCMQVRPCSGLYASRGSNPIGGCPSGTGCALLPNNANVMGCVDAGRTDVTYVNPDGSLAPGPNAPSGGAGSMRGAGGAGAGAAGAGGAGGVGGAGGAGVAGGAGGSNGAGSLADAGSLTASGSIDSEDGTTGPNGKKADLTDMSKLGSNKDSSTKSGDSKGFNLTSIIFIVVGCLAVVAVVAGVRLLKKKKAESVETPMDIYGGGEAGVMTPRENVLLL